MWFSTTSYRWNKKAVKCFSLPTWNRIISVAYVFTVDAIKTLVRCLVLSRLDYCNYLLSGMPQQLIDIIQKFTTLLQDSFLRTLNASMLHHYWINYTGFQQLKELNIKFLPCAMTQSEKLSRLTCLIYFNRTPHPVYCVPLLIPAVFGFQKERKRFKGGY